MKKFASVLLSMMLATGLAAGASAETYTGTAQGMGGDVSVTLTVEDGKITAAEVVGENETKGIGYEPCAEGTYAAAIVEAQGADIDNISGATVTTNAVKEAAKKAMVAAGLAEAEDTTVSDAECDVVIVGAGGAGMTAALQAVDAGVNSVIVVEKAGSTGGNTSRATGGMNAAKTVYQDKNEWSDATTQAVEKTLATAKEKYGDQIGDLIATVEAQFEAYKANPTGYFDSVELFALDTMVGGKCLNNLDLVMTLTGNSAEAIDWLATKNANLTNVGSFGGASVKRIHRATTEDGKTTPVGAYLVKVLTADVDAESKIDLRVNTAATELVMEDGKAVGAATVDMNQIQIHPSVYTETTTALITEGIRGDGAILVNQEGKRFVNELETRDNVSAAELAQEGGYAYTILDQKMMDASSTYNGYFNKGYAVQADSYEELAEKLGIDPATLTATMETWNKAVADQKDDEFGRLSFASALDTAPYYAIKVSPGIHHTMGGLKINTNAEVLTEAGEAIPGLYAAGEVTGGVHGANRLGGNAVADIVVFGRIAAQNAAAYIAK